MRGWTIGTGHGITVVEGKCDMFQIGESHHFLMIAVILRSGKHD